MATTKTLTPTNQAITLAAFTEKPDNRTNVTNDDKLADAVNTLNSKFTKTNLQSVSPYSSRCESLAGGYIKAGNIVIVSIIGKISTNLSTNDLFIGGLPKPNSTNLPLNGWNDSAKSPFGVVVNQNGYIGIGSATISANNYFTISGCYISIE